MTSLSSLSLARTGVRCRTAAVAPSETWRTWPAEQLWLCPEPVLRAMRARMRAVLADALAHLSADEVARIATLAEDRDYAAALRLTARLLYASITHCQRAADLAACALWLAVIEYRDERAALEFAHLVLALAGSAEASPVNGLRYPQPLHTAAKLTTRLRDQALCALTMASLSGGWGCLFRTLRQLAQGDPLAGLDAGGQTRRGWDL